MASFSEYLEAQIGNWLLGSTFVAAPANVYLGLSTVNPTDNGGALAEPSGGAAYTRKLITFDPIVFVNGVGTTTQNAVDIIFPTASADWNTITHGALFDASSGGNMLAHWEWNVAKLIQSGDTFAVAAGLLTFKVR